MEDKYITRFTKCPWLSVDRVFGNNDSEVWLHIERSERTEGQSVVRQMACPRYKQSTRKCKCVVPEELGVKPPNYCQFIKPTRVI